MGNLDTLYNVKLINLVTTTRLINTFFSVETVEPGTSAKGPTSLIWSRLRSHNKQIKMATTLVIVIVAFIVSWVPTFVADQTLFKRSDFHHNISFEIHLTLWAIYISPTVNPIIYALHNNTIRKLVIKCIQCNPNRRFNSLMDSNRAKRYQRGENAGLDDVKAMNPATAFRPEKRRSIAQSNKLKINLVLPAVLNKKKQSVIDNQIDITMEMVKLENLCEENTPVMIRDTTDNDITKYPTSADESIFKKRSNSMGKLKIRRPRKPERYFGTNSSTTI